jgi:hypothetical protein
VYSKRYCLRKAKLRRNPTHVDPFYTILQLMYVSHLHGDLDLRLVSEGLYFDTKNVMSFTSSFW